LAARLLMCAAAWVYAASCLLASAPSRWTTRSDLPFWGLTGGMRVETKPRRGGRLEAFP